MAWNWLRESPWSFERPKGEDAIRFAGLPAKLILSLLFPSRPVSGSNPIDQLMDASTGPAHTPVEAIVPIALARVARGLLVGSWSLLALIHLWLEPAQRPRIWFLGYLVLVVLACLSMAYRSLRTQGRERLAWAMLAGSAFLDIPNLTLQLLHAHGHLGWEWMIHAVSLLNLGTGLLVLLGVLSFPIGAQRGGMFRRRALDGLLFATSVLFLLWVMGVQGSLRTAAHGMGLRVLANFLNAALFGGSLVFVTSYNPDRTRGPLGWLAGSALAWLAALSCWTLLGLPDAFAREPWVLLAGAIPLFQGLAAWSSAPVDGRKRTTGNQREVARQLPYFPVVGALVVLALLLPGVSLELMRGAFGIFLAMVALLLLRQLQAIRDLQAARRTLEERVHQRTQALEQAQDTLLRTERMNTLALMGAGLAHDLNNLLSAIKGSSDLAAMNIEEGRLPAVTDFTRISKAADHAALLTRRLMGFVRREAEELSTLDLGHEVRELETTLRLLLPRTVTLCLESPEVDRLLVKSSKPRLEQMLVNLVANAGDAMPGGGTLTVRVGAMATEPPEVSLEIIDTGTGMSAETLDRIFEPFFTTKAPGKGTGLGLPSLKAMVTHDGGRIEVSSEPEIGTRFRILLPRVG